MTIKYKNPGCESCEYRRENGGKAQICTLNYYKVKKFCWLKGEYEELSTPVYCHLQNAEGQCENYKETK